MTVDSGVHVLESLAAILTPRESIPVSQWLSENLVLIDGPSAGLLWSGRGAPYLLEIADCLGDGNPCNLVSVRKSQQSGASILAAGWTLYIADREPANVLYAAPTLDALRKFHNGKLQPLIEAWRRRTGRDVIEPQTSRSGVGSTTFEKVFPRGRLWLGNANAVMSLSSVTVKKGVKDELSKWQDIPGYGDPETLFFGRFTAFRRQRNYKILEISTPEVARGDGNSEAPGHCRIDRSFQRSDQRFWHCPCPQCGEFFVHSLKHLKIDPANLAATAYICQNCGFPITDAERPAMIHAGEWRRTAEGPDRHPGFHVDAFISLMMSYVDIARDYLLSESGGEKGRKDFSNLVLGLPYVFKGNAPDHVRLMERREELIRGSVPARGLILVAAADVQMRGIWVEVVAFAPNHESWVVEALYLDGSTEAPDGEAFELLERRVLERDWPDSFGKPRKLDALGVDAGYRSHVVYSWTRARQRIHPFDGREMVLALDGRDGWGRPPLGTPSLVDIDLAGQKVKKGARLWPVGTWPLKGAFYADLAKMGVASGEERDPPGYCHFPKWLDETYFKQITAEELTDEIHRGRQRRVWKKTSSERDNHLLDCRIYNMALAEHLGLSTLTEEEWRSIAAARGLPAHEVRALFAPRAPPPETPAAELAPAEETVDDILARLGKANAERFR